MIWDTFKSNKLCNRMHNMVSVIEDLDPCKERKLAASIAINMSGCPCGILGCIFNRVVAISDLFLLVFLFSRSLIKIHLEFWDTRNFKSYLSCIKKIIIIVLWIILCVVGGLRVLNTTRVQPKLLIDDSFILIFHNRTKLK